MVTGIKNNTSVSLSSSGSVTCSKCGSVRNAGYEVEEHNADVHGSSSKSDGSKDDLKKLIEVEVRKQIWPNS